jgi:hypothetical protein
VYICLVSCCSVFKWCPQVLLRQSLDSSSYKARPSAWDSPPIVYQMPSVQIASGAIKNQLEVTISKEWKIQTKTVRAPHRQDSAEDMSVQDSVPSTASAKGHRPCSEPFWTSSTGSSAKKGRVPTHLHTFSLSSAKRQGLITPKSTALRDYKSYQSKLWHQSL